MEKYLDSIKDLDELEKEKLDFIFKKFYNLNKEDKTEFLKCIIPSVLLKIQLMEKERENFDCKNVGHMFTEWELTILNKSENQNDFVKYWKRKCTRCDLIDVSSIDPDELEKGKNK